MVDIYTGKRLRDFVDLVNKIGNLKRKDYPYKNRYGYFRYEVIERDGEIYPGYKWGIACRYSNSSMADVSYNGMFGSPRHAAVQLVCDLQTLEEWEWLNKFPDFKAAISDIDWKYEG